MEIKGIKFYDGGIKELPIARYNMFNAMLLNETGVGNDMDAVNSHLAKLVRFVAANDSTAVMTEANNLILCYYSAINKLSFKSRTVATLVRSIDKTAYGAVLSDNDLDIIVEIIEDRLTAEMAEGLMSDVKKKLLPT